MNSKQKAALRQIEAFKTQVKKTPVMIAAMSREMSFAIKDLIEEGFDTRTDPDGKKWKRRKKAQPWPILSKTKEMRNSFRVKGTKEVIDITNSVERTKFHQYGTKNMVARKMVPGKKMSKKWAKRLDKIARAQFQRHYAGIAGFRP